MPTKIYRFKLSSPGTSLDQLRTEIDDLAAIVNDFGGGHVIDVQADDSVAVEDNVKSSLSELGYEFVESNPTKTPAQVFNETLLPRFRHHFLLMGS